MKCERMCFTQYAKSTSLFTQVVIYYNRITYFDYLFGYLDLVPFLMALSVLFTAMNNLGGGGVITLFNMLVYISYT